MAEGKAVGSVDEALHDLALGLSMDADLDDSSRNIGVTSYGALGHVPPRFPTDYFLR